MNTKTPSLTIPNYRKRLLQRTQQVGNAICMGMDPIMERMPQEVLSYKGKGSKALEESIKDFYEGILNSFAKTGIYPAAVKPNTAYYEALGSKGFAVLEELIAMYRKEGMLVVLDAKRGDIGRTSTAYAKMAFETLEADAVTVAPYMGKDSIVPFQEVSKALEKGQGIYVLVRTSNPSAVDFQEKNIEGKTLYSTVAQKLSEWNDGNLGAVVGATAPRELEELVSLWKEGDKASLEIPCLIPGVSVPGVAGGQGGTLSDVQNAIARGGGTLGYHLINSSSGLNYAWEKYSSLSWGEATVKAMEQMLEA
jgi:orotidine-5'-phosphate decarboxylase